MTFEAVDGFAIVEGDIILGTVDELIRPPASRSASVVVGANLRWTDGVIPYAIDPELPNQERVRDAIAEWQQRSPIRLVERTEERNFVRFTRVVNGCASFVGMIGGSQQISVAENCTTAGLVHEVGHAIGLWHTMSRIDRDRYIQIRPDRIDKVSFFNFNQHVHDGDDLGPYDYTSIMQYGPFAFGRGYLASMETVPQGIPIGQRDGLSPGDVEAVQRIYGGTPDRVTISTNPPGQTIIVDEVSYTAPQTFAWAVGETHTVAAPETIARSSTNRLVFARWSDDRAREHTVTVADDWKTYTANFAEHYLLRTGVSPPTAGTVSVSPPSPDGFYPANTALSITALATSGFNFLGWTPGPEGVTGQAANGQGVSANPTEIAHRFVGAFYVAGFTASPVASITSTPLGRTVIVDGASTITPRNFVWTAGSTHTVSLSSTQIGLGAAERYNFRGWSDGGSQAHTITAGAASATLTAEFGAQFRLTTSMVPFVLTGSDRPGRDHLMIDPLAADGYYDRGATVSFKAGDGSGFRFSNWSGDLTGPDKEKSLIVDDEKSVTATYLSPLLIINTGVVHEATQQPDAVAPGQAVVIHSPGLGPQEPADAPPEATELAGITILFDELPAQMVRASRNQFTVIAPVGISGRKRVSLAVRGAAYNFPRPLGVLESNPGLYTADGSGFGPARAFNEDGSANAADNPARRGSDVTIHATGVGIADALWAVDVGGVAASLGSAESAGLGVTAFKLRVHDAVQPGSTVPLVLLIGGRRSQSRVTIAIAQ